MKARTEKGFEIHPNVLVAEADLKPNEVQDFAEQLLEIRKAAGAFDLKMHLRLELDGRGKSPAQEIVAKLNDLLAKNLGAPRRRRLPTCRTPKLCKVSCRDAMGAEYSVEIMACSLIPFIIRRFTRVNRADSREVSVVQPKPNMPENVRLSVIPSWVRGLQQWIR